MAKELLGVLGERPVLVLKPDGEPLCTRTIPYRNLSQRCIQRAVEGYPGHPVYVEWGRFDSGDGMRISVYPIDVLPK